MRSRCACAAAELNVTLFFLVFLSVITTVFLLCFGTSECFPCVPLMITAGRVSAPLCVILFEKTPEISSLPLSWLWLLYFYFGTKTSTQQHTAASTTTKQERSILSTALLPVCDRLRVYTAICYTQSALLQSGHAAITGLPVMSLNTHTPN